MGSRRGSFSARATSVLVAPPHLRIVHATDPDSREKLFRFRHRIYVRDLRWLEQAGDLLVDDFDSEAHNYAALDGNENVVGSVRIVLDGRRGLPLERCHPMSDFRRGKHLAEVTRMAVAPGYRASGLVWLLMKAAYRRCLDSGVTHIVMDTYAGPGSPQRLYERLGFEHLGGPYCDPSYRCSAPVLALAFDLQRALSEWPVTRPGLYRFFTSPAEETCHD